MAAVGSTTDQASLFSQVQRFQQVTARIEFGSIGTLLGRLQVMCGKLLLKNATVRHALRAYQTNALTSWLKTSNIIQFTKTYLQDACGK
mmetsp:Transcript_24776/g.74489  ORF Transcript_24776/g.74489 Transcript_24776/m.74489 type:complete len:89 (-) Transcript_24776:1340-1606(-)